MLKALRRRARNMLKAVTNSRSIPDERVEGADLVKEFVAQTPAPAWGHAPSGSTSPSSELSKSSRRRRGLDLFDDLNVARILETEEVDFHNPLFKAPATIKHAIPERRPSSFPLSSTTSATTLATVSGESTSLSSPESEDVSITHRGCNPLFQKREDSPESSEHVQRPVSRRKVGQQGDHARDARDPRYSLQRHGGDRGQTYPSDMLVYERVASSEVNACDFSAMGMEDGIDSQLRGFWLDVFARNESNEGETGKTAHLKFVFTPKGPSGEGDARKRTVLDALHNRTTSLVQLTAKRKGAPTLVSERGGALEYHIQHVGPVIFYPRIQSRGHHLYILSLHGRTLFSILA
ncbi:unnamed protein product [Discosporangium mesarthrocarpum]